VILALTVLLQRWTYWLYDWADDLNYRAELRRR
jgi:hypothetical protein